MTFFKFHLCLSHLVQLLLFRLRSSIVFCGGGNISFIFYYFIIFVLHDTLFFVVVGIFHLFLSFY